MSDFLHQLRNGNDKRFNRKRRQYDGNQNVLYDRRNNRDNRRAGQRSGDTEQANSLPNETLSAIRDLLETIIENQERQIITETRKAEALDNLVEIMRGFSGVPVKKTEEADLKVAPPAGQKRKRISRKKDDPNRIRVMEIIDTMRKKNATYQEIAQQLEEENLPTFSGRGKWHAQTVHRLCQG